MAVVFYEYKACSTCRNASKWLSERSIRVEVRPIVDAPPGVDELRSMWRRSGLPLQKFFNTSGQSYRALDRDKLAAMSDDRKLELLAADGKLIKRPLLDDGKNVLVGFSADAYESWSRGR